MSSGFSLPPLDDNSSKTDNQDKEKIEPKNDEQESPPSTSNASSPNYNPEDDPPDLDDIDLLDDDDEEEDDEESPIDDEADLNDERPNLDDKSNSESEPEELTELTDEDFDLKDNPEAPEEVSVKGVITGKENNDSGIRLSVSLDSVSYIIDVAKTSSFYDQVSDANESDNISCKLIGKDDTYEITDLEYIIPNQRKADPLPTGKESLPEVDDEPEQPKKNKMSIINTILAFNNRVGDAIYAGTSAFFGIFRGIPLLGRFLSLLTIIGPIWRIICRLWLIIIILLVFLFSGHGGSNSTKNEVLKSGQTQVQIVNYSHSSKTISVKVKNTGNIYDYYHLKATVYKKSFIPFYHPHFSCVGPIESTDLTKETTTQLKCTAPIQKVKRITFDIVSDN